jgi:hypothetical protein
MRRLGDNGKLVLLQLVGAEEKPQKRTKARAAAQAEREAQTAEQPQSSGEEPAGEPKS